MHAPTDWPLSLWPHGPLKMPQLHDKPRHRGCWECGSHTHHCKQCPQHDHPNHQCTYCQSRTHQSPQYLFKWLAIPPPNTHTITEALNQTITPLTWCGKCLCNNPGHAEVDCPTRELCHNCSWWGNLFFLQTHNCDEDKDQHMYSKDNEVPDPSLYGDGESWSQANFNLKKGVMLQSRTHFTSFPPYDSLPTCAETPWLVDSDLMTHSLTDHSIWHHYDVTMMHAYSCTDSCLPSLPTSSWLILTRITLYVCSTQTSCTSI